MSYLSMSCLNDFTWVSISNCWAKAFSRQSFQSLWNKTALEDTYCLTLKVYINTNNKKQYVLIGKVLILLQNHCQSTDASTLESLKTEIKALSCVF